MAFAAGNYRVLAVVVLVLSASFQVSVGAVYKVGDSAGWTTIGNVDYKQWAATKNFRVGDVIPNSWKLQDDCFLKFGVLELGYCREAILTCVPEPANLECHLNQNDSVLHSVVSVFVYNPQFHNVMQVTHTEYQACNASSPIATHTTGNDTITITTHGHHLFLCGVPGHCQSGQKVDINVIRTALAPTPSATPSPPPVPTPAPAPNAASPLYNSNRLVRDLGTAIAVAMNILCGFI